MKKKNIEELKRAQVEHFKALKKNPIVIILDNVRSMHNVGAIFRTADAFLVEKIILCGITASPPHREIHKTALGATESVEWHYCSTTLEAVQQLKQDNYIIAAVEQMEGSTLLHEYVPDSNRNIALVFGNEVMGISDEIIERLDLSIEIPQYGTKHSFNISVSVGIILWDILYKTKNIY